MTKKELVKTIAEGTGLSKKKAEHVLKAVIDTIVNGVKERGRIMVKGLGVLKIKERAQRKVRNPRTGEIMEIPARKVIVFKAEKKIRESL